jgi:hypothetical protein
MEKICMFCDKPIKGTVATRDFKKGWHVSCGKKDDAKNQQIIRGMFGKRKSR